MAPPRLRDGDSGVLLGWPRALGGQCGFGSGEQGGVEAEVLGGVEPLEGGGVGGEFDDLCPAPGLMEGVNPPGSL
jgi:hypothetical protein